MFIRKFYFVLGIALACLSAALAADQTAENAQRERAVADYVQKMRDANYPALFDKAAREFNVPPDVLKAVSFAETRWTQLEWPPGETVSPDNGMPRAFGIMSLWDNDFFAHTLTQAAQLIGQSPETLKTDVFQNMRGGAALLRQLYDQTPKPADAPSESQIESWRKAIAKYTGLPQPELNEAHALRVYEFMNQGYHEYGIEWNAHPVNLDPMRADVARIKAAALAANPGKLEVEKSINATAAPPVPTSPTNSIAAASTTTNIPAPLPLHGADNSVENQRQRRYLAGLMLALIAVAIWYLRSRKKSDGR